MGQDVQELRISAPECDEMLPRSCCEGGSGASLEQRGGFPRPGGLEQAVFELAKGGRPCGEAPEELEGESRWPGRFADSLGSLKMQIDP